MGNYRILFYIGNNIYIYSFSDTSIMKSVLYYKQNDNLEKIVVRK